MLKFEGKFTKNLNKIKEDSNLKEKIQNLDKT